MNRISRTGLAALGAVVVVAAGGLGMAYATTPASEAQASATPQDDQVEALNRTAQALQSQAAEIERTLAASSARPSERPEASEEPSESAEPSGRPTKGVQPTAHPTNSSTQAGAHSDALDQEQSGSSPDAEHIETGGAHD